MTKAHWCERLALYPPSPRRSPEAPLRRLGDGVDGMQLLAAGDGGQNRRTAAGEERRRTSAVAEHVEQPRIRPAHGQNEPAAITARARSLAIMMRLRSMRSSSTPATGPANIAGIARARKTPATTTPEWVTASASRTLRCC